MMQASTRRLPKPDRRRALELLAASRDGCTEAIMLAHGFTTAQMVELMRAGLASAATERVVAGRKGAPEVARVKITDQGRQALAATATIKRPARAGPVTAIIVLLALTMPNAARAADADCVFVTQNGATLHKAPKASAKVIARLQSDDELWISEHGDIEVKGWIHINAVWRLDGNNFSKSWRFHSGWVKSQSVKLDDCKNYPKRG